MKTTRSNLLLVVLVTSVAFLILYVYSLNPKHFLYKHDSKHDVYKGEHDIKLGEGIKLEDNIELKENIKLEEDMEAAATHESSIILQPTPISNEDKIHVVLSFDHNRFVAVTNVINSLKKYSNNVVVHIITDDVPTLESLIKCCNISGIEIDIRKFVLPKTFIALIKVVDSSHTDIDSLGNFARFFFHEIFPNHTHLLYLDVDVIIQHDITELWLNVTNGDQLLTATKLPDRTYGSYMQQSAKPFFEKRYGKPLDLTTPCIMGGVYGVNLNLWRELKIHEEIMYWMTEHHKHTLWTLGTQPLLMIVAYGRLKIVSSKWDLTGLGWKSDYSAEKISEAYIVHWNGRRKPWVKDGLYKYAWDPYTPERLDYCMKVNKLSTVYNLKN